MVAMHFRVEFNRRILLKNVMKIQEKIGATTEEKRKTSTRLVLKLLRKNQRNISLPLVFLLHHE